MKKFKDMWLRINSDFLEKLMKGFFTFKYAWGRADGYIGFFADAFQKLALLAVYLKTFDLYSSMTMIIVALTGFTAYTLVGFWDLRRRWAAKENTILNSYNDELMKIHEHTTNGDGK